MFDLRLLCTFNGNHETTYTIAVRRFEEGILKGYDGKSKYRKILFQLQLGVGNNFVPNVTPESHLVEKLTKTSER